MNKLEITLKQHTPLIHFQHDQDGATLRASEVKPKLDRFLLTKLGDGDYLKGLEKAKYNKWLIDETKGALKYRMRISPAVNINDLQIYEMNVPELRFDKGTKKYKNKLKYSKKYKKEIPSLKSYPLFFGNMDIDYKTDNAEIKRLAYVPNVNMELFFPYTKNNASLSDFFTKEIICEFFLKTNFGSRQSKGFGAFYVDKEDKKWYVEPTEKYSFKLDDKGNNLEDKFRNLFNSIDLFYKTLRGGINLKGRGGTITTFYFKSLAFMYAKNKLEALWDKRAVKEHFYNDGKRYEDKKDRRGKIIKKEIDSLDKQRTDHNNNKFSEPLFLNLFKKTNDNLDKSDNEAKTLSFCDIRDLLGFSTDEQWISFRDIIEKKSAIIENGNPRFPKKNENLPIERMQSPLLFKPINNEDGTYTIFLVFQDDKVGMKNFKKQKAICFYSKNENEKFILNIPEEFSTEQYFNYIFNELKFDISTHVETVYHSSKEYETLEKIYSQLKNNSQCNTQP